MSSNSEGCIAVILVHYGDPAPTRACLDSIAADPSRAERRVVVVDNSDTFQPCVDGVRVLRAPDNPGFGGGVQRGLDLLRGDASTDAERLDIVLALNHDVRVRPGFFDALRRAFDDPGVGAVGGPIYSLGPGKEEDDPSQLWYAGGGVRRCTGTVWQSRQAVDAERARSVGFIPGTALAVRLTAWQQVGGFDASYFLYHEDLDLCLRLRHAGWRLWFEPAMACNHDVGGATGSSRASALYLEWMARNRFRPFRGHLYRLYLALLHSGWVLVKSLPLLASPGAGVRLPALWRGHLHALRHLGQDARQRS